MSVKFYLLLNNALARASSTTTNSQVNVLSRVFHTPGVYAGLDERREPEVPSTYQGLGMSVRCPCRTHIILSLRRHLRNCVLYPKLTTITGTGATFYHPRLGTYLCYGFRV